MKRVASMIMFAGALCVLAASPTVAQDWRHSMPAVAPAAPQESPQTVKAAIPQQVARPTPQVAADAGYATYGKPSSEYEPANVKLEVTITYQVGNAAPIRRTATVTVADQGRGSLRAGNQVAVPETQFMPTPAPAKAESSPTPTPNVPMTSFSYRLVGLNVDANRVAISGNKTRLDLSVEFSAVEEKPADQLGRMPSFPTFSQNLTIILESGKPLVVAQTSDIVDNVERRQSVEVKATILR